MSDDRLRETLVAAHPGEDERVDIFLKQHFAGLMPKVSTWLKTSRERTNFTYDLAPHNQRQLAAMVGHVCGQPTATVSALFDELLHDDALQAHHGAYTKTMANLDPRLRPGRRLVWYAMVRLLKPRVVIETGIDKGMGALVLCAALARNAADGAPGRYFGTDINVKAGGLLTGAYADHGRILYGDSIKSLEKLDAEIDLFINDSDHSAAYEAAEYDTVAAKLAPGAVILGDNAHVTSRLQDFAEKTDRAFLFAAEKPRDHWYPGAGVGIAFPRQGAMPFQDGI